MCPVWRNGGTIAAKCFSHLILWGPLMSSALLPPPTSASHSALSQNSDASPERIAQLSQVLSRKMHGAVRRIQQLNEESKMLSLNAQIEAARSGQAGATFAVVAQSMRELANATAQVAATVSTETSGTITELERISNVLATNVRGARLSDLALVNIDLIDRNLYERSCDCRWWATDDSLVAALAEPTMENRSHASHRMGVILNSYTVYFDLVLADASGRIVANGRPDRYDSTGKQCRNAPWFDSAMATGSGEEFGFQGVHESALAGGQRVLVYSAGVRERGDVRGKLLGVLGVVFNWDGLAQTIVENTPLVQEEKSRTRVCIVDQQGLVLADTRGRQLRDTLSFANHGISLDAKKQFAIVADGDGKSCIAHAKSPGFETYATGWHSLLIQEMPAGT